MSMKYPILIFSLVMLLGLAFGGSKSVVAQDATPPRVNLSGEQIGLGRIYDIALAPDASFIVAGGHRHLWILETADLSNVTIVDLGDDSVANITFSPDGSLFAVGLASGDVQVWDAASRELSQTFEGVQEKWANLLVFSADNRLLASVSQRLSFIQSSPLTVLDIQTGEPVFTLDDVLVRDLAFNPDASVLAGSYSKNVMAWDIATGEEIYNTEISEDQGSTNISFNDDGSTLFVFHSRHTVSAIDAVNWGEPVDFEDGMTNVPRMMIHTGNNIYVSIIENTIVRFDVEQNKAVEQFTIADKAQFGSVISDFDVAGDTLVALMGFHEDIIVYDLATQEMVAATTVSAPAVANIAFNAAGDKLMVQHQIGGAISNLGGSVLVWDISGNTPQVILRDRFILRPQFNADGDLIGMRTNERQYPSLVNLSTGETIFDTTNEFGLAYSYNPDIGLLANRNNDLETFVYNYTTGVYVQTFPNTESIEKLILSDDGQYLAQISRGGIVDVWNLESGDSSLQATFGELKETVSFTEQGFWILAGDDRDNVRLLGYEFGNDIPVTDIPLGGRAEDLLAISPDGSMAVVAPDNAFLRVIDLASGEIITELLNQVVIYDVVFSPDNSYLAIGEDTGDVIFYPLAMP